jgi:hypothetical protein
LKVGDSDFSISGSNSSFEMSEDVKLLKAPRGPVDTKRIATIKIIIDDIEN